MVFTPQKLADLTEGTWDKNCPDCPDFSSAFFDKGWASPSSLWVTTNSDQWPREMKKWTEDYQVLSKGIKKGMRAIVVRPGVEVPSGVATLRVADTWKAMRKIAFAVRDHSQSKRLLVTGTEGKTGFKVQLNHALKSQMSVYASIDSRNMSYPILSRLAKMPEDIDLSIFEVSVPKQGSGKRRASYIQPQICVITEIGYEHLRWHGDVKKLIRNKASVVSALAKDGICIVKSDPKYFSELKKEIAVYGDFPIYSFGLFEKDNAQLIEAKFQSEPYGWKIKARIEEKSIEYFIPALESHAPLSSLPVLLTASLLGLDVEQAAQSMVDYQPYQTSGRFSTLPYKQGALDLYDQSFRSYLLGYRDFFEVCSRLIPQKNRKKIVVLGMLFDEREYGDEVWTLLPEAAMRQWLIDADFDEIHTIGEREQFEKVFDDGFVWKTHHDKVEQLIPEIIEYINPGDLLMIKGDRNENMFLLSNYLRKVLV